MKSEFITKAYKNFMNALRKSPSKLMFPAIIITVVTLVFVLGIISIWKPNAYESFLDNLLSEFIGIFFDVAIVVLLFAFINFKTEKRQRIERYKEEIEDYRPWNSKEATWRLRGLIKRMNNEGVTKLNLKSATLNEIELWRAHLEGSDFSKANLMGAKLWSTHLEGANLQKSHLEDALLQKAHLEGTQLQRAHLEEANLREVHLEGANLYRVHLERANLYKAYLKGASLLKTHLEGADLSGINLELRQLKTAYFSNDTIMMDGTPYDESWAKRIAEAENPRRVRQKSNHALKSTIIVRLVF